MKKFPKYLLIGTSLASITGLNDSKATEQVEFVSRSYKVQKKHRSSEEIPSYIEASTELFKRQAINKENFDQTIFNDPHFSNSYSIPGSVENIIMDDHIPMRELKTLADLINLSPKNTRNSMIKYIFNLFDEVNSDYFDIYSHNKKSFFIFNHLLGNQKVTRLAKGSLEEYLQYNAENTSYIDSVTATYVYVLLDSESPADQNLARKLLEKIPQLPFRDVASSFPAFIQQLSFSKNTSAADEFLRWVIGGLPKYMGSPDFGYSACYVADALKMVAPLFGNPSYKSLASDVINFIVKGDVKIQGGFASSETLLITIPTLLSFQETQEYAINLFEERVLSDKNLKAQDKWRAISRLAQKDKEQTKQYIDKVWNDAQDEEDQVQFLFKVIRHSEFEDILFSKVHVLFDKMANNIKTLLEEQRFYEASANLSSFINFLASSESESLEKVEKAKIRDLVNQVLQLPEGAWSAITTQDVLSQDLMNLIQKSGLNAEEILVNYGGSVTVNPQFFINMSKSIPEKESFLLKIYQSPAISDHLKAKILIDLAKISDSTSAPILSKNDIISDLFNLLEKIKQPQGKTDIYEELINLNDSEINMKVLENISQQFTKENLDQQRQLFMLLAKNSSVNKENKAFETMFNVLLDQATNPYIDLSIRKQLVSELTNGVPQFTTYFTMLGQLNDLEDTIKRTAFGIGGYEGDLYSTHSNVMIRNLKFIVENIQKTLQDYPLDSSFYSQVDLIQKTEALLDNTELMKKALGLGEETERYITEAKDNLKIFQNKTIWNGVNHELSATKIDGQTITLGQTYSLFFHYIDNQNGTESYLSLIAGLVQALASTEAMNGCKEGTMSQMGLSIFKEHFKEENQEVKEVRSLRNFDGRIPSRLGFLKSALIDFLSQYQYKAEASVFNIQDAFLIKEFPDIQKNEFLESTFSIFNQIPLEKIFGDDIHTKIPTLFSKLNDSKFQPSEADSKTIKDVYRLIINPTFLAFLSKEYSDFVVFDQNREDKLFFPGYVDVIEKDDLLPYRPVLLN